MNKKLLFFLMLTLPVLQLMAQSAWKSPTYQATTYRKVLVLAKTTDEIAKREIEDATVKMLGEKGIAALPAYANIAPADAESEEKFLTKADALEIDALLVYTLKGKQNEYKNTPSVNMSVGVPVRVGIFGGFIGTNVPIAGGAKTVTVVNAAAVLYNRSGKDMQWQLPLSGKLKNDAGVLAASFAKSTVKALLKDKMFLLE
jgi:hypothetical protein